MSDRQLWLREPYPRCAARSGRRCQTSRYSGKSTRFLHSARGWRYRVCPTCTVQPGELCRTPSGRRASQPHAARLHRGRRELVVDEQVWEQLEHWEAGRALVRFSGGGGSQGSIAAVWLEAAEGRELARWSDRDGALPEALAAPIWGRYGLFRGHPRITGLLMWDVRERHVLLAGQRGEQKFDELLCAPPPQRARITLTAPEPPSPSARTGHARSPRGTSSAGAGEQDAPRRCERCGQLLPAGLRPEARYCSKRCRQAGSRERLKQRPPSPTPSPRETRAWCEGPMPQGRRLEARYCSKCCRQAASWHELARRRRAGDSRGRGDGETASASMGSRS